MGRQNRELLKNIKKYEEKEIKQQESKVLEQGQSKRSENREKNINVYSTSWSKSLWGMAQKRLKLWSYQKLR